MFRIPLVALLLVAAWAAPRGHSGQAPVTDTSPPASEGLKDLPRRLSAQHLPSPVQVHPKVISGGLPEGDEAFQELQTLGVKTVISVDGMKPDVALAKKYGMRYVHLPHGYDGIPERRVRQLAKAVRELDGPVYIHCHHGKHRSPAAASVACIAAGLISESAGVAVLGLAETSPNYRGLYESAREAKRLDNALLDELEVEFPETSAVPPMADAMVSMGHTHDHLKAIAGAGWQSPPEHPDLDPAHEALLMREHFTELLRSENTQNESPAFRNFLRDSEEAAQDLENALRERKGGSSQAGSPEAMDRLLARISMNCKACHEKSRDVPLSEK